MNDFKENVEKYADLAIRTGVNLQLGQTLVIVAPIEAVTLVRVLTEKAYDAGAKHVLVEWSDDELSLIRYRKAPDEAFTEYPSWKAKGFEELAAGGAAFLTIYAPTPGLLKDINPERIATEAKTNAIAMKNYRNYTKSDEVSWSIIAYPTEAWAQKVFPDQPIQQAIDQLWNVIFKVTRVYEDDPNQAWSEHNAKLAKIVAYLNNKQYQELSYEMNETKLSVALPKNHVWKGGASVTKQGTVFNPNLPTEEVYTMPHKDGIHGVVHSTKPLNYGGNVIDQFSLVFEQGMVVDFSAETGYETLQHLLKMDEGARHLGEVALVPYRSPISLSNVIFYNTLFDENASCHFALGQCYPTNITGGTAMNDEELAQHGGNKSHIHVDFMMGGAEMNIDAITEDGKREPLFRNGEWAIEGL
ncbi:aminopeptidase [Brevibacillus reuszeri]|uniref:Aminopeptidase n=1 Tax=Brevibacillus reuszeri TaxID=54915 RepID=A0A0K9YQ04_9BACL|nr:aminopeptidase [Brevibacillus reuszeri]KNB70799.1 peptidase M29 [Brevibacillus reuszeri]MED1857180.1 aminopeptidase [Brevibacillus reuszeri]GED66998.1 aminopeptidase [Brevibacillus reuszeri]